MYKRKGNMYYSKKELQEIANNAKTQAYNDVTNTINSQGGRTGNGSSGSSASGTNTAAARNKIDAALKIEAPGTPDAGVQKKQKAKDFNSYISGLDKRTKVKMNAGIREGLSPKKKVSSDAGSQAAGKSTKSLGAAIGTAGSFKAPENRKPEKLEISPSLVTGLAGTLKDGKRPAATVEQQSGGEKKQDQAGIRKTMEEGWTSYIRGATDAKTKEQDERIRKLTTGEGIDLGSWMGTRTQEVKEILGAKTANETINQIAEGRKTGRFDSDEFSDYGLKSYGWLDSTKKKYEAQLADSKKKQAELSEILKKKTDPATNMERVQKLLELRTSPEIENERKIINGSGYTAEQKENASRQLQEYNAVAEQTAAQFATFYNDYVRSGHTDYTWDEIRQMAYDSVNGDGAYDDAAAEMSPEEKAELDARIDAALAQNEADEYADVGRDYNTALSRQRYAEGQIRTINSQITHNLKGDTYMIGAEAGAGITSLTGTGADGTYHEENDQWQEPSGQPKLTGYTNATRGYDPATEHNMRLSKADQIYHKANNPGGRNITEDELGRAYLMTDEERETFNRLYNGGNKRQAEAFYDGLSMALNERMHWYSDLAIQEKARRMPISSAIAARGATVMQPIEHVIGKIAHWTGDKNADDPYSPLYALTRAKGLTDQQISGDLGGVGGFFYNAMMSGLDSYINLQMTAALGIPQGSKWFQGASLALFGTQAYQTSLVRGLEETKGNYMSASIYAYLDAAIETATEIWSLEALMGDPTNMLAYLAKVAAAEGSEEFMGSAFGPYAKDLMYSFLERHFNNMALHRNEWTERADNILAMGGYFKDGQWVEVDNADDAMRQALREWNHDILISTASGAVSTFGSGMHGVKQNIQNRYEMKKMGRNAKNFGQSYQQNGPRAENLDELAEGQQQEGQEQQEGQPAVGEQQNAGLEELLTQADRMAEETESAKVAAQIRERQEKGQEVSDSLAGKLVRNLMVESEESEAIERKNELKRTLRKRLLDSGEMNTAEANRKADLLMKQVNNEELTKAEQQELNSSKTVKQLDNELRQAYKEGRMTEWQAEMEGRLQEKTKGMREIQQKVYQVSAISNERTQKQIKAQQEALGEQLASREDIEQAEGQRTGTARDVIVDGQWGTVQRMVTAEETADGEKKTVWKYEVDVGGKTRTVDATEIKAADFTAASIIREQALNPGLYSAGFTNKLLDLQNRGTVKNVGRFLSEAQAVRIAAFTGTTMPTTSLDNSTALEIYNDSLKEAQENRTAEVRQTQAGKRTQRIMFKGAEFGTDAYKEAIKDLDRNTVREMEAVAGVAQRIGIDVTFRTPDELKAYGFQTGDTVELNIGARNLMNTAGGGRQNMMVTFGHELTHWLQEHSMAGYNSLRNFVFSEMQKNGVNIQRRVGEIMANRQGQGINLTLSQAVSEIVANACDQILTDGAVQQRLEEVKPKLAAQVKNFVKDLMGKIRRASTGMSESRSADARNFYLSANELAKRWIGAYDEAINNIVTEAEMPTAEEVKNFSTEEINAEYMDAVRDNNKPLMRRILDEAARRAGYTEKAFHGSDNFGFTQFDLKKGEGTIFVAYGRRVASTYVENNELKDIADMDFRNLSQDRLMELVRMVDEGTGGQMTDIRYNDETNTYEVTMKEEGETVTEDYTRDELVDMLNGYLQNVRETRVRDRSRTDSKISSGIYRLYVRPGRELHVDAAGAKWNKITVPWSNETMTTREIAEYARVNGFDSVRIDNVIDNGKNKEWGHSEDAGSIGIFFNEADVKSADLVTRDNNGKIIKPSERFNDATKDLRYSVEEVNRKIRENDFTEQETKDAARILQNAVRYPVKNFKVAEPVEMRTDGMMAIHNLSVENLLAMLKLGGIASPSIALIARNRHWTGYGPVSIFFGRTSVDPMISSNRLYNGDAYTPTMGNASVQTAEEALEILRSKQNRDLSQAYLEDAGGTTRLFRDFKRIASMSEARAKAYAYETEDAYERSKQYHKAQDMERNIFRAMRESLRKHTGTGFKFGQSSSVSEAILMAAEELQQREEQGDLSRQEKHQIIQLNLEEACRKNRQSVLSFEQDPGIYDQILDYIDVARTLESGVGMMESKPDRIIGVNEWMAVQLPAETSPEVIDALADAGIDGSSIYLYDTLLDKNSRANQQREIALKEGGVNFSTEEDQLNRYRSNILGQHERIVQYYENEWDNLLKNAGISQADARALTMNADGSLNTDGMSSQGAEAARKLKKSQLKRLQMFDRQIRKWSNTKDAVMGLTMDDLGMQYEEASEQNDKAKMDELLLDKASRTEGLIPYRAPQLYDTDRHRWVANAIKEGNAEAIKEASFEMAQLVPQNAVLIPMAPHTGKVTANTDTMLLAREISRLTGRPVINAMEGAEREKRKETKLKPRNKQALAEDLGFRQVKEIPEGTIPIFIDNMIGSGETAKAALMAFGHGVTLAYAKSTRAAIDGLKNVGQTWIDKEKNFLVPLDAKYDMSVTGFKGTNFSVEETNDYYEQARKNNDVPGMMGIIDAIAQRAMPRSKVRDENGDLLLMYHGTGAEFTEFRRDMIGSTGQFEGAGFNFTPAEGRASSYGKKVLKGYLDIQKPLSAEEKTISVRKLAEIIRKADPTGDNIISNYANETRDYGKPSFVQREAYTAARSIWDASENDVDIYSYISAAGAHAEDLMSVFESMGYDGLIHYYEDGRIKTAVAFNSNQFKSAEPVTYDNDGEPIKPSERFNLEKEDIRWSVEEGYIDYKKPLREQLMDFVKLDQKWKDKKKRFIIIGTTPKTLVDLGMAKLPMVINYEHLTALLEGKYRDQKYKDDHIYDIEELAHLPELISKPVAVIKDSILGNVKVIIDIKSKNGNQTLLPISINMQKTMSGHVMDINTIKSVYGSNDIVNELKAAIENDSETDQRLYYLDNKKAQRVLDYYRTSASADLHLITGTIHMIPEESLTVNDQKFGRTERIKNQYDTIQFRRWFGKSKVVNADGTPKVMYHGTKEQFTKFSKDKAKSSGAWGKGFYFTDEKTHAGQYGEQMEVYLRAENPLRNTVRKISRRQMARFIEAVANNEEYGIDNYGYGATVQSVLDSVFSGKSDLEMLNDINSTCIGDFAEAIALFNQVNGTRYDSVITDLETVVYDPNQIKSATDNIGTFDGDDDINFSVEEMSDADRVRYAISEDGMDVMNWMAGLTDSGLMTEGEQILLQAYKDLRMKLQVCLQRQRDYTAKIKKLEARGDSLTFDEREELRKLRNNLETQQLKQDRLEDELYKVTDSEGYAGTMYRQNKLLNDFIYGRTQEQVDQTVRDMMKEIGSVKTELEKRRDELKKLGEDKAVRTIREQMSKTSLSKAAAMLRKTYGSTMNKGEIEGRLAEMALKLSAGEDIMPEAEALAEDLAQKIRGEKSEALEALRGTTLVIGRETLRQIKEEQGRDSSLNTDNKVLKIIRDKLRGSGIKVAVERNDMFDAQWEDLRENNKAMPDLNEIAGQSEKLNVIADWVAQQLEASRGINQAQVDMAEMAALIYANVSNIGVDIVTDPVAKKQLARINAEVQEMARKVSGQADAMAALEEKMNSLILAGTKARGWTSVLNRDVKAALDYYSKTAKLAAQTERQKVRTVVVEQLKSEHTRKLVQQRLKYEAEIAENRKSQQLYLDNESLRKKTNTVVKRLRKLLTAETDKENIPDEAKPLARMLCSLIVNHDMVFRKVSYGDKKQLEDVAMRLRKMDAADGPFDVDRDLSWLIVGSGEDVDTEMRDRAMQDLADIEDGLLKYRMAEGKRNITLQDRKEALQKIQRAASEIYSMIQARRGAFVQGQRVMVKDLATQMEEEMKKSTFKGDWKGRRGRFYAWTNRELNYGNLTPEYFFKNLKNSVMNLLHGEFHEAENRFGLEAWKSAARVKQIAEECGYANWDTNQKIGMKLDSGRELYMTLGQVMSLYATWKREQQQLRPEETSHLLHGGFVLVETDNEKGAKRERSRQRPIRINEYDAAQLGDLLTEEQRQYVDRIVEYMSTDLAELGNEASMKMYGIRKYTEKYYFPIKSWGGVLNSRSDAGVNSQSENRSGHQGFTKRIRANAANAIEIGDFTQTAVKHIVGMMTYNSIAPAVENMNRVLNQQLRYTEGDTEEDGYNRNMRAAFQEYYGKAAYDYLVQFMQDINGSNGVSKNSVTIADKLLGAFKKNAVAGSMSVALQQPMSYIRAAMMINPKYMTKALAVLHGKNNSYFERMKYSGVSVIKEMGRFEMNSGKSAIDYIMPEQKESGARAAWNKVTDNMTILPEKMDAWTWNRMWVAVKLEQMDAHPDMDHESDAFMKIVAERFNDLMRKTQVYDSALVKSQNMRDTKSWVRKTMTNFMAEPTLTLNVLADAFRNIKEPGGKANAAKAVALFLLSAAGQAGIKATLGAGRSPDKNKTQWENWLYKFWYNLISEVNVLNLIPGYGKTVDAITDGEVKDDTMSMFGKGRDIFKNMFGMFEDLFSGKENKNWYRDFEDGIGQFLQIATNAPVKNMMRDFRAMVNFFSGGKAKALTGDTYAERESSAAVMKYQLIDTLMTNDMIGMVNSTLKLVGHGLYGTGNSDYYKRIYESLNSGNQQAADEMKEYLIQGKGLSESGVNTKIREQTKKDENLSESEKIQRMSDYGGTGQSQGDYITDQYKAGKLSREDAERMFSEAYPDKKADSIWWTFDRIDYKKETGAENVSGDYYRLHDAIENNKSDEIQGTVKLLMEHGKTKNNIKDNITDTYRPKYLAAEGNEKIRMKDSLIKAYKAVGLTAEEAEKLINKWKPSKKK